jgi:hypothetical protein
MNPKEFLATVYLGDRGCKKILIDGWSNKLGLQVNCISRIRDDKPMNSWGYYNDEDVDDGWLVFSGLRSVSFTPSGPVPNDELEIKDVREVDGDYVFTISAGSGNEKAEITEVIIEFTAESVSVETNQNFLKAMLA